MNSTMRDSASSSSSSEPDGERRDWTLDDLAAFLNSCTESTNLTARVRTDALHANRGARTHVLAKPGEPDHRCMLLEAAAVLCDEAMRLWLAAKPRPASPPARVCELLEVRGDTLFYNFYLCDGVSAPAAEPAPASDGVGLGKPWNGNLDSLASALEVGSDGGVPIPTSHAPELKGIDWKKLELPAGLTKQRLMQHVRHFYWSELDKLRARPGVDGLADLYQRGRWTLYLGQHMLLKKSRVSHLFLILLFLEDLPGPRAALGEGDVDPQVDEVADALRHPTDGNTPLSVRVIPPHDGTQWKRITLPPVRKHGLAYPELLAAVRGFYWREYCKQMGSADVSKNPTGVLCLSPNLILEAPGQPCSCLLARFERA